MKIVEYETIIRSFTFLKLGDLFRESLGGAIYLKILPVTDKHGGKLELCQSGNESAWLHF